MSDLNHSQQPYEVHNTFVEFRGPRPTLVKHVTSPLDAWDTFARSGSMLGHIQASPPPQQEHPVFQGTPPMMGFPVVCSSAFQQPRPIGYPLNAAPSVTVPPHPTSLAKWADMDEASPGSVWGTAGQPVPFASSTPSQQQQQMPTASYVQRLGYHAMSPSTYIPVIHSSPVTDSIPQVHIDPASGHATSSRRDGTAHSSSGKGGGLLSPPRHQMLSPISSAPTISAGGLWTVIMIDDGAFKESGRSKKREVEEKFDCRFKCYKSAQKCARAFEKKFKDGRPPVSVDLPLKNIVVVSEQNSRDMVEYVASKPWITSGIIVHSQFTNHNMLRRELASSKVLAINSDFCKILDVIAQVMIADNQH